MIRFALAVLLAGALASAAARAEDDEYAYDEPGEAEGEDAPDYGGEEIPPDADRDAILAQHGAWVQHASWGRVWRPRVVAGWRPYTSGYWAWSPYGWTWVSNEPWGWSYHYGRWGWYDSYGWVWVPGSVWAPAWVDWWEADGWIGWAPLGPTGWSGHHHHYVFVRDRDFCDRGIRHRIHDHHHVSSFKKHGWSGRRGGPPALHRIERVARDQPVRLRNPRGRDALGTHRLPAPTRPGGAHARGEGRDVRRTQVPRVPNSVRPHRPGGSSHPGWARGGGQTARPGVEVRPPGRAEFGRGARGGRIESPRPRSHVRGDHGSPAVRAPAARGQAFRGGGGRGRGRIEGGTPPAMRAPGGRASTTQAPSMRAPGGAHRIAPGSGTGGVRGGGATRGGGQRSGGGPRVGRAG